MCQVLHQFYLCRHTFRYPAADCNCGNELNPNPTPYAGNYCPGCPSPPTTASNSTGSSNSSGSSGSS